ncbi:ATP-binding protein [Nitrospira sp. BLG_1]|uniref:ATP-binding protein n=1 Tax=Nitrospira sp. BLG_1 TaxID=3395883 RepID=UPI0039BD34C5
MQTTLSHSLFHSRIGRRILGLFVLCALVPTSLFGWMSYRQVTQELIAQSAARLKQESKSQGMVLYHHLLTFTADLSRIAAELPQEGTVTEAVAITESVKALAHRFRDVRLSPATGPHRRELTQAQTAHLQEGKSLLEVSSAAVQLPQLTLTRLVNPARWEAGLLSAYLDDTSLWSTQVKETLPGDTDLVVEDGNRHTLYSTFAQPVELPDFRRPDIAAPMGDGMTWKMDTQEYIAGAWSMPLRHTFLVEPWIIVLSQTRASALAPVERFRHTFLLVIACALSAVVLLSMAHIRRSLQPVTLLQEGTARLATGNFSTQVTVQSGDEFEQLADSFNSMTDKLNQQFQMLETLSAISQAILSSHEPATMVKILQSRITESIACDAVGMMLLNLEDTGPTELSVRYIQRHENQSDETKTYSCQLSEEHLAAMAAHPHHLVAMGTAVPSYLSLMMRPGLSLVIIFPIIVNERVSGVLALAYRQRKSAPAHDVTYARRLADQVAIALANSLAIQARLQAQSDLVGAVDAKQQAEEQATLLQATNESLATKEERLRHQQSATLALVQDRTVFEGSLPVTAKQLTTIAAQALLVDRVSVWIYDEQTQSLYCLDHYDRLATRHTFGQKLLRGQYPHYLSALDRGQLIAAAQARHDPFFQELADAMLSPDQIGARLDAPFHTQGKLAGVVSIEHIGSSRDWASDEQQFAQALANFMTLVLEAARRRESEEALAIAKLAAEDATKAKAEFLANMSHEIRTPMNGVIGMTEILARTPLSETQRHYVETIHNSGDTLLTLINDILDFSKIEAGKLEIQSAPIDLRDLVERTAEQLAERAQRKGLHLLVDYSPSVPTAVSGDSIRIRQIVTNLLGNAIKFTQDGEVSVRVTLESPASVMSEPARIKLAVIDTGSGISPEGQAKLFQSFSQVDGASTRVHGGTGLGLSICKQLSALMGGTIGVDSEIGKGSTFWVILPFPIQSTAPVDSDAAFANLCLCAAVTSTSTRHVLSQYFSSWGISPHMADSEGEFLEHIMTGLAIEQGPVVAVIDDHFDGLTDMQIVQTLLSDSTLQSVKIIRLVSLIRRAEVEQDTPSIRMHYVTKPIRFHALHHTLRHAIADEPIAIQDAQPVPSAPTLSGHILLGEDNPVNQEIALLMLQSMGCTVTVAQNGREVVEHAQRSHYDVILMDCQMPEMDGFEATTRIRQWERHESRAPLPIIALTAHATPGDREQCLAKGMSDYISKPFSMGQLHTVLTAWLPSSPITETLESPASSQPSLRPSLPSTSAACSDSDSAFIVDQNAWKSITGLQRPGKPDVLAKILSLYLADSHDVVATLRQGMADENAQVVSQAAHSLRSRSAMLGAVSLSKLCRQLEDLSRQGQLKEAESLVAPLTEAFTHASQIFQAELERRPI